MNYQQTIEYLFSKLPLFSRIGAAAYKKDLSNTIALCEVLGNPQRKIRTVHIAGTNGKGSVSHMLAAILQSAGYKTGLYTSPHFYDFRERIKIDGAVIEKEFVVDFTQRLLPHIDQIQPSFFEVTVAMAFEYFAIKKVDIAIIETGMGGRLDSTNVITPLLSVITNIDWDHMQLLGDSLEKIAFEKAGIIKAGVPVVIGEPTEATLPVFMQKAQREGASLTAAPDKRSILHYEWKDDALLVQVANTSKAVSTYTLDLPGIYQLKNILTVLASIEQLQQQGWQIDQQAIVQGLASAGQLTGLFGRWQKIGQHPTVVIDVAHNEAGIRQLLKQLKLTTYQKLHIIIGVVKDKSVSQMLSLLPKEADYYFTKAQLPRALAEHDLVEQGVAAGLRGTPYAHAAQALAAAKARATKEDLIVICGSIFLAAEINPLAMNDPSGE